jgi:CO/xanthine dehydrogenase Mo-binding subunit
VEAVTGLPASAIKVYTASLGEGPRRKIERDYVSQPIQIAQAVKKPVKPVWSRDEGFGNDRYRPMALSHVRGGLQQAGQYSLPGQTDSLVTASGRFVLSARKQDITRVTDDRT